MNKRFYILILLLFAALNGLIYVLQFSDAFTYKVLFIGNIIIFALTFISFSIANRFTTSDNNGTFVRGVMGGTFLKFFLAIVAALIYIFLNRGNLNIIDIISLMIIYIIYTTIETVFLAKSSRATS